MKEVKPISVEWETALAGDYFHQGEPDSPARSTGTYELTVEEK